MIHRCPSGSKGDRARGAEQYALVERPAVTTARSEDLVWYDPADPGNSVVFGQISGLALIAVNP